VGMITKHTKPSAMNQNGRLDVSVRFQANILAVYAVPPRSYVNLAYNSGP